MARKTALSSNATKVSQDLGSDLARRNALIELIMMGMPSEGVPQGVIEELATIGWSQEHPFAEVTRGPYTFGGQIAAAGVAAATTIQDLTTYAAGPPSVGPLSLSLFSNFKPTAGKPNTMIFATSFTLELDLDPTDPKNRQGLLEMLSSATLHHTFRRADAVVERFIDLGAGAGTLAHAPSSGVAIPAAAGASAYAVDAGRVAVPIEGFWPIYPQTDTFELMTNGCSIPNLGTAVSFRIIVNGVAVLQVADPGLYRNYDTCDSDKQAIARMAAKIQQNQRRQLSGLGTTNRIIPGIGR